MLEMDRLERPLVNLPLLETTHQPIFQTLLTSQTMPWPGNTGLPALRRHWTG